MLAGNRRGLRALLPFAGPAFVASVAYMDPGNFATNIQGGAGFGYRLLWVVVLANLMAMLFQGLSAKLGIATGKNLAELARERAPKPVASACGSSASSARWRPISRSFSAPSSRSICSSTCRCSSGAIVTGVVTYAILALHRYGFRTMETLIGSLVGVIAVCYVVETLLAKPNWHAGAVPLGRSVAWRIVERAARRRHRRRDRDAARDLSALRAHAGSDRAARIGGKLQAIVRFSYVDVVIALTIAGLVNSP